MNYVTADVTAVFVNMVCSDEDKKNFLSAEGIKTTELVNVFLNKW